MEDLFSSNSEAIINKKLDIKAGQQGISTDADLDFYFDIEKVSKWVDENLFKRVKIRIFLNITNK